MKPVFAKNLSAKQEEPWVWVSIPGTEGVSRQDVWAFRAGEIKSLRSFGPAHSLIRHQEGSEHLIALPFAALIERLEQPDGNKIDLSALTVVEGKDVLVKKLKEEFRRAQELEQNPEIAAVTITANVRASQSSKFVPFTFAGKDIRLSDMKEGSSIHGGPTVNLRLYPSAASPFGNDEVIIEGKLEEFRRLCREAVARGEDIVDMSEYSMKKFKNVSPAEARRRHEQKSP